MPYKTPEIPEDQKIVGYKNVGRVTKFLTKSQKEEEDRKERQGSFRFWAFTIAFILLIMVAASVNGIAENNAYVEAQKRPGPTVTVNPGGGQVTPGQVIYLDLASTSNYYAEAVTIQWDTGDVTTLNRYEEVTKTGILSYYVKYYYKVNAPQEPGLHTLHIIATDPGTTEVSYEYIVEKE